MGWEASHLAILGFILISFVGIVPKSRGQEEFEIHRPLEEYVHHYETLNYDNSYIDQQHKRHKRSAPAQKDIKLIYSRDSQNEQPHVDLEFSAHGRDFKLRLKRDYSVFHNDFEIEDGTGNSISADHDLSHIYEGHLIDPNSDTNEDRHAHCFGAIRDGVFDGQINTCEGTFYVERANKYFPDLTNDTFHSVIYHEKHLKDPFHHSRSAGQFHKRPGCGISDSTRDWMESIQRNAEPSEDTIISPQQLKGEKTENEKLEEVQEPINPALDPGPTFKYSAEANDESYGSKRVKRAALPAIRNNKKTCHLYIQTDPLFWRHIYKQEKNEAKTKEEILSLIAQHVKAVNRIYSDTEFNGKYSHHGYQFSVQRIKIHNDTHCADSANRHNDFTRRKTSGRGNNRRNSEYFRDTNDPNVDFCQKNIDVSNFLNMHSKTNHQEFCLAYVFTYRDFVGGTLGLAWVASASGASGGICETYKSYRENVNGEHKTAKRSLNTGIITFVNYNSRVPPKVSQLTLAHEIGHNFGSPHDYPEKCRPGGKDGNYIMFASATSGDRYNNNKFSNCSKQNVSAVLDAITDGHKLPDCFRENEGAFCGNKIVEPGEECDCGYDESECEEQCCYPRKTKGLSDQENKERRCKRKENTECSPSEGPCCNSNCKYVPLSSQQMCKIDDDCTDVALCDGTSAKCPEPGHKKDNVTECNDGTQVCQGGDCKASICLKYGLEQCFLTSDTVTDIRQLCELACKHPEKNNTCMSTKELVQKGLMKGLNKEDGLSLRPGSPCDDYQGYCDVFLKCRKVDAEGPLVRLKNLLLNQETLLTIAQWVTEFWYAVLLMGIAFVIFMACFIRCFAIHTPSSNPRLPKNLHFTETLRRPVRAMHQKHYHRPSGGNNHGHHRGEQGAPPPYPGRGGNTSAVHPPGAPGRGYGEGRGHYNRSRESYGPEGAGGASQSAYQGGARGSGNHHRQDRHNERRSGHRSSRIEMQPMR